MTRTMLRASDWYSDTGRPRASTTRSDSARLPGVRPWPRVSNQTCHDHVSRNERVRKTAYAMPGVVSASVTVPTVDAIAVVINASSSTARKRLPAPAGSRPIGTCSGVVIVSSSMSVGGHAAEEEVRHQRDEEQRGHGDLHFIRKGARRKLRERSFDEAGQHERERGADDDAPDGGKNAPHRRRTRKRSGHQQRAAGYESCRAGEDDGW